MIVRVGVGDIAKELEIEMESETSVKEVKELIESALNGEVAVLWLSDKDGRQVGVPVSRITYVDIGTETVPKIGFGA
jgi:DNA-binding transcriptional regulator LsrR (DeoR family)